MTRRPSARDVSLVDGIILGCLLGSLILVATIQSSTNGIGRGGPMLRILVAAALAGMGLSVFVRRLVQGTGWTLGMRLLAPLAVATLIAWIVIAVRLVRWGGPP